MSVTDRKSVELDFFESSTVDQQLKVTHDRLVHVVITSIRLNEKSVYWWREFHNEILNDCDNCLKISDLDLKL